MLYAQQSCKNVIAIMRILVVHKLYMKERKKNNACQSKPIGLTIFLIELLYDKRTIEYTQLYKIPPVKLFRIAHSAGV